MIKIGFLNLHDSHSLQNIMKRKKNQKNYREMDEFYYGELNVGCYVII